MAVEHVTGIAVMLGPPGIEISLSEEQIKTCIPLLRQVVIYNRKSSFGDDRTGGQVVRFTITDNANNVTTASFYGNITLAINNLSYRVKYEESEALNAYCRSVAAKQGIEHY